MSIRVMDRVWSHSQAKGIDRLVLLAIADHASDDGGNAWPSIATLARKAAVDQRTVQRAIRRLVKLGELVVDHTPGGTSTSTNWYRVVMVDTPGAAPPRQSATPAERHPGAAPPRQPATPTPGGAPPGGVAESPETGGTAPPKPKEQPSINRPEKKAAQSRGTRLPDDWRPNDDMREWTLSQISKADAARELTKFRNYWQAKASAAAKKVSWDKTWHNWIIRVVEERGKANGSKPESELRVVDGAVVR